MVPLVGVSSPAIMRRSVVFPHPDGPTSTTMRGLGTVRLKSSTATTPSPNTLRIWEKIRSDMVGKGYGRGERGAISKGQRCGLMLRHADRSRTCRQQKCGRRDQSHGGAHQSELVYCRSGSNPLFHKLQDLAQRLVDDGEALVDIGAGEVERRTEAHRAHAAAHDEHAVLLHLGKELGAHFGAGKIERAHEPLAARVGHLAGVLVAQRVNLALPVSYTHLRAHETPEHL